MKRRHILAAGLSLPARFSTTPSYAVIVNVILTQFQNR